MLVVQSFTTPVARISTTFVARTPTTALTLVPVYSPSPSTALKFEDGEEPQALGEIALVLPLCCV